METPTLSKKQQKKALSSKKAPLKSIRNVFVQPYEKYWPLINGDDQDLIKRKLNEYLPQVRKCKIKIPWSEKKVLTKQEYRNKLQMMARESVQPPKNILNSVVFGINAVTRCMEKGDLVRVLLSAEVEQSMLTNHISVLASSKGIPLLVMNDLEDTIKNIVGFKSITVAFKCNEDENYFKEINDVIFEISKKYPITSRHISHIEPADTSPAKVENSYEPISDQCKTGEPKVNHLFRASQKMRSYVPPKSRLDDGEIETMNVDNFISITNSKPHSINVEDNYHSTMEVDCDVDMNPIRRSNFKNKHNKKFNTKYIPLKVKRIQGNPKRLKKNSRSIKK